MAATKSRSGTVDYTMVNTFFISDFVPSRETRVSSNPTLQEHFFSPPHPSPAAFDRSVSPQQSQSVPVTVKYLELEFSSSTSSSLSSLDCQEGDKEEDYSYTFTDTFFSRSTSADTSTTRSTNKTIQDRPIVAKRREEEEDYSYTFTDSFFSSRTSAGENNSRPNNLQEEGKLFRSRLGALEATKMERPASFAMAISENPIHFDSETTSSDSHYYINVRREPFKSPSITPISSPPPQKGGILIATRSPSPLLVNGRDTPTETHPLRLRSTQLTDSLEDVSASIKRSPSSTSNLDNRCSSPFRRRRSSDPSAFYRTLDSVQSQSFVGEEIARFSSSYIGSCSIDQYLGCVDESAKKVIDPKMNTKSTDVLVQVCTEKIRLFPPKAGPVFKSFLISDIMCVSQCSKNKRLVGIVIWKPKTLPQCHLLRSSDHLVSNALLESIQYAMQCVNEEKVDKFHHSLPNSSSTNDDELLQAIYVGCTCVSKHQDVSDIVHKTLLESKPSQTLHVCIKLELSHIEFTDATAKSVLLIQATSSLQSLGVYGQEEGTYLGYIAGDPVKGPLTGHVLWCGTYQDTIKMANAFRQVCQVSYQQMIGKGTEQEGLQPLSLFSRIRSFKGSGSSSSSSSSFQSYVSTSSSHLLDIPRKCKNLITVPTIISTVTDCSEEEFAKFPVNYIGTANLLGHFTYSSITEALDAFQEKGVAAGKVPPSSAKNIIDMYISSLGINLADKKQKMFVSRNYPRKQIVGCSQHLTDRKYFSFATMRPGFSDQLKVHVFMESTQDTVEQVMKSIKFWLQINPLTQ